MKKTLDQNQNQMNRKFYRDLRNILLETKRREVWQGRLIVTVGEEDPRLAAFCFDRPRVPQPNSINDVNCPSS